jgi:hypothetical protein
MSVYRSVRQTFFSWKAPSEFLCGFPQTVPFPSTVSTWKVGKPNKVSCVGSGGGGGHSFVSSAVVLLSTRLPGKVVEKVI